MYRLSAKKNNGKTFLESCQKRAKLLFLIKFIMNGMFTIFPFSCGISEAKQKNVMRLQTLYT